MVDRQLCQVNRHHPKHPDAPVHSRPIGQDDPAVPTLRQSRLHQVAAKETPVRSCRVRSGCVAPLLAVLHQRLRPLIIVHGTWRSLGYLHQELVICLGLA